MAALGSIGLYRPPVVDRKKLLIWQNDPSRSAVNPYRYSHKPWVRPQVVFPILGDFLVSATKPNLGIISGVTQENGIILPRCTVRLYHRETGYLAGQTTSDSEGFFSFRGLDYSSQDKWFVVAHSAESGESYNAIIADKLLPYFEPLAVSPRTIRAMGTNMEILDGVRIGDYRWHDIILTLNPAAYYQMSEVTTGTQLVDSSENGLHGVIGGNVLKGQDAMRPGGGSMYFSGVSGSNCTVPYDSLLAIYSDTTWTVSFIVKAVAGTAGSVLRLMFGIVTSNLSGYANIYLAERSGVFNLRLAGNVDISFVPSTPVTKNTIYRCFVVRDGSSISLYINGELAATATSGAGVGGTGAPLLIGGDNAYPTSYNFNGYISDVAFFNYALTETQISLIDETA